MKPIDFRNETFTALRERLVEMRERVWLAWRAHELAHAEAMTTGATTREVATAANLDLLCLRPRATELYQMGLLALAEPGRATLPRSPDQSVEVTARLEPRPARTREGRYRLRSIPEWEAWHTAQRAGLISAQQQLPISA